MNRAVQAGVSVVVGALLAAAAAYGLVVSQSSTPQATNRDLVVYDG